MQLKLQSTPTKEQIVLAAKSIAPYVHQTPVLTNLSINTITGCSIFFKCENFQKIGAFKMRGASYATLALTPEERQKGIATHSSGNHAQAVALSAKNHGIKAYIVMPENAPAIKRAATAGYGAEIITCAPTIEARQETLNKVVAKTGATFIPPYNDYHVICGQATVAKELLEQTNGLDIIMAPVGGGGLMSGTCLSVSYFAPNTKVIGAEPKLVDDAYRSLKSGKIETNSRIDTIADGLRTNLGTKTFDILQKHLDEIITVSEEEIIYSMRLIWERMKIIIEPSSAVPLAAILQQKPKFAGKSIGIILTGGNVDINNLPF